MAVVPRKSECAECVALTKKYDNLRMLVGRLLNGALQLNTEQKKEGLAAWESLSPAQQAEMRLAVSECEQSASVITWIALLKTKGLKQVVIAKHLGVDTSALSNARRPSQSPLGESTFKSLRDLFATHFPDRNDAIVFQHTFRRLLLPQTRYRVVGRQKHIEPHEELCDEHVFRFLNDAIVCGWQSNATLEEFFELFPIDTYDSEKHVEEENEWRKDVLRQFGNAALLMYYHLEQKYDNSQRPSRAGR